MRIKLYIQMALPMVSAMKMDVDKAKSALSALEVEFGISGFANHFFDKLSRDTGNPALHDVTTQFNAMRHTQTNLSGVDRTADIGSVFNLPGPDSVLYPRLFVGNTYAKALPAQDIRDCGMNPLWDFSYHCFVFYEFISTDTNSVLMLKEEENGYRELLDPAFVIRVSNFALPVPSVFSELEQVLDGIEDTLKVL